MKVGIVVFSNIITAPYLYSYVEVFRGSDICFDVVYFDRKNNPDIVDFNTIYFSLALQNNQNKFVKFFFFWKFFAFLKKTILKNKYDFLIILTSVPACFLSSFLINNYNRKYIIDIRDYSYERIPVYKFLLTRALRHSCCNVISSPGFKSFLPVGDYVLCHNMNFKNNGLTINLNKTGTVRIGYIGMISYLDQCLMMIDHVKNDFRFEFHFYGFGVNNENINKYINNNVIKNVFMHGAYEPSQKSEIYKNIDIIFNVYGNDSPLVKYTLSNKYYDAAYYKKPLLVSDNTTMGEYSKGISFVMNFKNKYVLDDLYDWYTGLDPDTFNSIANKIINDAIADNMIFKEAITQAL